MVDNPNERYSIGEDDENVCFCRNYALVSHTCALDQLGHRLKHRWRQRQVEEPIRMRHILELEHLLVEHLEVAARIVAAGEIVVQLPELVVFVLLVRPDLHVWVAFGAQLRDRQFRACIAVENGAVGQEIVAEQPPQRRINFLFRQVTLFDEFVK